MRYYCMCAACFIVFLKSRVSCQALAEALQQNSTLTSLDLRDNDNNIGPEGAKAWCLVCLLRMVSSGERERHSHSKVNMQCSDESQVQMPKRVRKGFP